MHSDNAIVLQAFLEQFFPAPRYEQVQLVLEVTCVDPAGSWRTAVEEQGFTFLKARHDDPKVLRLAKVSFS